ncbi:MAG: sugar porter family MFS transporter [Bacteroidales bacterium]|nr:sugar porter family MFS transporter [Bacteroidales bacterium]
MNSNSIRTVFIWSIIVALGGFLFGFDTAVISGVEQQVQELFSLSSFMHGFTIASALIGTVIGALIAGRPADRFGRKPVLLIIAILYFISAIGCAAANNVTTLIIFRFIGGIGVGGSSVVAPMYISEISPAHVRGRMTALFQFNVISGILIAYVSNYLLRNVGTEPWRWMLGIEGAPAFLYFVLLFFIPESPRYLIKIGQISKARLVLEKIIKSSVDQQVEEIRMSLEKLSESTNKLFSKRYFKPVSIAFLVAMFNQFSGINAILYYAPRIFELSGLTFADSLFQSILIGITNGIFTIVGMILIDRAGRKILLITGSIGMSVCLALVAKTFYTQNFEGFVLLIYLLVYIMFFAFSTGAVIWVLIAEIFPNNIRGKGQSLGSFTHWFFAALVTFTFPVIIKEVDSGAGHTFMFFSLMMILQAIVVWKYFPETKRRTLEELGQNL